MRARFGNVEGPRMGLSRQADVLARLSAIGGIYGIDLTPLQDKLGQLAPRLARGTLVTVPITFDRLTFATRVERADLDAIAGTDQLVRFDRLAAGARHLELELETDGVERATTLRVYDGRDLVNDGPLLLSFGLGTAALDTVRACADELGVPQAIADRDHSGTHAWQLDFRHRNGSDEERETTRRRIGAVARKLGVTEAQRNLVDGLHDMATKERDSDSVLLVNADEMAPQLAVRWHQVRWETAIRMALGFRPGSDVGKKLGELSGAFDAEQVQTLELVLTSQEPPRMRVAVACIP
jgi:hypothetical protein